MKFEKDYEGWEYGGYGNAVVTPHQAEAAKRLSANDVDVDGDREPLNMALYSGAMCPVCDEVPLLRSQDICPCCVAYRAADVAAYRAGGAQ